MAKADEVKRKAGTEKAKCIETWDGFINNTTFHGIKYVFQKQSSDKKRQDFLSNTFCKCTVWATQLTEKNTSVR